jgi:hypothetical protein
MPKTPRGSTIGNNYIAVKMIGVTFLDFPNSDKAHWVSTIGYFFMSFVNVYLSRLSPMPKGIVYLWNLYANNLCKLKPPSVDVDEYQSSATVIFV